MSDSPQQPDSGGKELQAAKQMQAALSELPEEKRKIVLALIAERNEFYSGPIMPPRLLADIDKVIPGGAERVLQITEKEQAHRHHVEILQNETFSWQAKVSLMGGLSAFILLVLGIIYCAAHGYTWGVGSLATLGAFGVISHIVRIPSRNSKKP